MSGVDAKSVGPMVTVPQIAWKELQVGTLIGNGSYGDVYRGQWQGV